MANSGQFNRWHKNKVPIPNQAATMFIDTPNGVQKMLTSLGLMRLLYILTSRMGGAVEVTAEQIELMWPGQNLYFEYNCLTNGFIVSTTPFEDSEDAPEDVEEAKE